MRNILKAAGVAGVLLLGLPILELLHRPGLPDGLYVVTISLGMAMLGLWAAEAR